MQLGANQLGANDRVWKTLASEANARGSIRTRKLRSDEKSWLEKALRTIHTAYEQNDVNTARIQSHNIVNSGYRRMGSPQAWERVPPTAGFLDPFGMNQNQLGLQLQQNLMDMMGGFGFRMPTPSVNCPQPPVDRNIARRPPFFRQNHMSPSASRQQIYGSPAYSLADDHLTVEKPNLKHMVGSGGAVDSRQHSATFSRANSIRSPQGSYANLLAAELTPPMPAMQEELPTFDGYSVGDQVMRKNQKCVLVDIDFSTNPPDAIIQRPDGRRIITEFDQLERVEPPKKTVKGYDGYLVGDEVIRKGQICTLIDIDFSMDPPGAIVLTHKGTEASTEFSLLTKHEQAGETAEISEEAQV